MVAIVFIILAALGGYGLGLFGGYFTGFRRGVIRGAQRAKDHDKVVALRAIQNFAREAKHVLHENKAPPQE
jgi:hypothetical protein